MDNSTEMPDWLLGLEDSQPDETEDLPGYAPIDRGGIKDEETNCVVCLDVGQVCSRFCKGCYASTMCDKACVELERNPCSTLSHYEAGFLEIYRRNHKGSSHIEKSPHKVMRNNPTGPAGKTQSSKKGVVRYDHPWEEFQDYPDYVCSTIRPASFGPCLTCVNSRRYTLDIGFSLFKIGYTMLRRSHRSKYPRFYELDDTVRERQWSDFWRIAAKDGNAELQRIITTFRSYAHIRGLKFQIEKINEIVLDLDITTSQAEVKSHCDTSKNNYSALDEGQKKKFEKLHRELDEKQKYRKLYYLHSAKQIEDKIDAWKWKLEYGHSADPAKAGKMLEYANSEPAYADDAKTKSLDIFKPLSHRVSKLNYNKFVDKEKMHNHTEQRQIVQRYSRVDVKSDGNYLEWAREAVRISYIIFEAYECPLPECDNMKMLCPVCYRKLLKAKTPTSKIESREAGDIRQTRQIDRESKLRKVKNDLLQRLLTVPDPKVRR